MCSVGDIEECCSVTFPEWLGLPRDFRSCGKVRGVRAPPRGNREAADTPWSSGKLVLREEQGGFRGRAIGRKLKFGTLTGTETDMTLG